MGEPLTLEERYKLRLHVTKTGEPLLDRLLFEHDRMADLLSRRGSARPLLHDDNDFTRD